ncbi:universal stress protein [Candidatus Bathyarchaeota archaeon]|jgi:nucleotide-binding universal stress UspA family protein|nr:universal stress protein [Candidatus Bathyarchaeota archaeon]
MYRKILVAFDGSEPSKHAMDIAVSTADKWKAELVILSVVPRVMMPVFPDEGFGAAPITAAQDMSEYQEKMKEIYASSLREAVEDINEAFPDLVVTTKLMEGRPSAVIVDEAEEEHIDLIVIGSRGIGGITGWILGSTSRRVVESCTKPILVVK